jgi:hypothetical protein
LAREPIGRQGQIVHSAAGVADTAPCNMLISHNFTNLTHKSAGHNIIAWLCCGSD